MDKEQSKLNEYLSKQSAEAIMLAVLEYDKLLIHKLNEAMIPGKTTDQKIRAAIEILSDPLGLAGAREVAESIKNKLNYDLIDPFGENIILQYKKALGDLDRKITKSPFKIKYLKIIQALFLERKKIKSASLIVLGILIGILFFADTSIGNNIAKAFLAAVHGIFKGLFYTTGIVIFAAVVVVVVVMVIERLRK